MYNYNIYGSFKTEKGYLFRTYAPGADLVELLINGKKYQMKNISGAWETEVEVEDGTEYLYLIHKNFEIFSKLDPYGRIVTKEDYLNFKSVTYNSGYKWQNTKVENKNNKLSICEVYMPSLIGENYRDKAHSLVEYLKNYDFTHIQIMPVMQSNPKSLGYLIQSFFSIDNRFGSPDDLRYFVDYLHGAGYGVIFDVVFLEFIKEKRSLDNYDGSYLYNLNKDEEHPVFHGLLFDIKKEDVIQFLSSYANFYINEFMADGIRLDGVNEIIFEDFYNTELKWEERDALKRVLSRIDKTLILAENITLHNLEKLNLPEIKYVESTNIMYDIHRIFTLEHSQRTTDKAADIRKHNERINEEKSLIAGINHDIFMSGLEGFRDQNNFIFGEQKPKQQILKIIMTYALPGHKILFKDFDKGFKEETNIAAEVSTFIKRYNEVIEDHKQFQIFIEEDSIFYGYDLGEESLIFLFNTSEKPLTINFIGKVLYCKNELKDEKITIDPYEYGIFKIKN
jgi:1,4-alpha-glucan branching enzyme